jgi:hypothetical protein
MVAGPRVGVIPSLSSPLSDDLDDERQEELEAKEESHAPRRIKPVPSFDPDGGLSFVPRFQLETFVNRDEGLILCGAGAPGS